MTGIGTIVNVGAVVLGSGIGILAKKGIPERIQNSLMKTLGACVMFIGVSATLAEMFSAGENGEISTSGTMMMIVSLVLGTLIGELLKIEDKLEGLGDRLKKLKFFSGSSNFTEGFVTTTLVISVGAMSIVGSLRDGLNGDPTMLYSKSLLDFFSGMIFASTLGIGAMCAAIPMGIYQGLITVLAGVLGQYLTDNLISNMSLVGSVMIFAVGVNLAFGKKFNVGNMLPGLIIALIYGIIFG